MSPSQSPLAALKTIAWFVLAVGAIVGFFLLWDWAPWLPLAVAACGLVVAFVIVGVWRLFNRNDPTWSWSAKYRRAALAGACFCLGAASLPIIYAANLADNQPAVVPTVTLQQGDRTVVLQGMMHVGAERFYKSVVYDLENALSQGYVLFYEGVKDSPGEGDQWMKKAFGDVNELMGTYRQLASACGFTFQLDYFTLMEEDKKLHPERHYVADVSTLDMKHEFERLAKTDEKLQRFQREQIEATKPPAATGDMLGNLVSMAKGLTPAQQKYVQILCRAGVSQSTRKTAPGDSSGFGPMRPIILLYRNRNLAQRIIESPAQKIYVTYGAEHLAGVSELLEKAEKPWKVTSVKWSAVAVKPVEYKGREF